MEIDHDNNDVECSVSKPHTKLLIGSLVLMVLGVGFGTFVWLLDRERPLPADVDPEIVQLRVLVNREEHAGVANAADRQQTDEQRDGRPVSETVYIPGDTRKAIARWVPVVPKAQEGMRATDTVVREVPSPQNPTKRILEVLVILDDVNINRTDIRRARPAIDNKGRPCVTFAMTTAGAMKLEKLTARHLPHNDRFYRMGIIVDGSLFSAPRINSVISDSGIIEGEFTEQEVEDVAMVMMAHSIKKAAP